MAQIFIEPTDLDTEQARQVLLVLNQAADAPALAQRIELPGEPDIGVRLAERLLRARAQLGGAFASLDQVAAVPQIGPERFTDLCVALLGLTRAQLVGIVPDVLALQARLARLEQLLLSQGVNTLGSGTPAQSGATAVAGTSAASGVASSVLLSLEGQPQPAWLGQTLQITLKLRDADGLPLVNRVLTLEASEGLLQFNWGFAQQQGQVIRLRTGVDGSARISLDYQPGEPLQQDQVQALQQALDLLDARADAPDQIKEQFKALATRYDDSIEVPLRHAIDIYSRDSQSWWQRFNTGNAAYEWPLRTVIVRAYLHGDDGTQHVQAQAVLTLCWKDWLPAWFTYLHDWMREQAGLASTFARAIEEENGTAISERVIADAHSFVASQRGFAAQLAGQHLVGDAVSRFLAKNIDNLSPEAQEVLFPTLDIAAEQIRAGNRGTLALVKEASKVIKLDVARDIGQIGSINAGLIEEATSIRDEIGRQREDFNTSLSAFGREYSSFQDTARTVTDKLSTFDKQLSTFNTDYGAFKESVKAVDNRISVVETKITAVEEKINLTNTKLATFDQSYVAFTKDYGNFTKDYGSFTTQLGSFNTQLGNFNTQIGTFSSQLTSFNTQFNTFKQDLATFNTERAKVGTSITQFNTDLGTFQQNYSSFQTQRAQLTQDISVLKTDVSTLKVKVNTRPT